MISTTSWCDVALSIRSLLYHNNLANFLFINTAYSYGSLIPGFTYLLLRLYGACDSPVPVLAVSIVTMQKKCQRCVLRLIKDEFLLGGEENQALP